MNDLLDLSMPASSPAPSNPMSSPPMTSPSMGSAFNLSSPVAPSAPAPRAAPAAAPAPTPSYSGFSGMDAWGSNDVWASSGSAQPAAPAAPSHTQDKSLGWGATPQVTQDDDFGGWSSAAPVTTQTHASSHTQPSKPAGGFGGGDDLFSNVWE
jgi:stromal membrane-associated protein